MLASGCAALGYQIAWTQQSALWLGHEAAGILAVVGAFFGGLALGSLGFSRPIDHSRYPLRWYAGCEALIGLWALVLAFLMPYASDTLLHLIGPQPSAARHWAVAFFGTFVLLLPATAAMGATLPAMERVLGGARERGDPVALLYAANTAGAVLGVGLAAFWLVPDYGLVATIRVCAGLNLLCALVALFALRECGASGSQMPRQAPSLLPMLAATGLLGIGYEVLAVRVLSQVAENTVYTFALLLAVYLVGTAMGAAAYARWHKGSQPAEGTRDALLRWLALACLLGMAALMLAQRLKSSVLHALGETMGVALLAEALIGAAAFLPPTLLMGALFSHLCTQARRQGIGFGEALGINTLGAACAAPVFGVVLVPLIGPKLALLLVVAGYLLLASPLGWRAPVQGLAVGGALAMAAWAPALAVIDVPEGGRAVSYAEGTMATVSVVEDAAGVASLHINNRQPEGTSATLFADARQALLPVLLHPAPRRALFLGLGTGVTASAAASDPALEVHVVELLPEVAAASRLFTHGMPGASRLHVMAADARRFVRSTDEAYDLVVSDNFHPARSGSGSLYTVEHFRAVGERLAPGGIFCQWLPLHQLDLDTLRSIVRSFLSAHRHAWALLATNSLDTPVLGLVARNGPQGFDANEVHARLVAATRAMEPAAYGLPDELAVLGSFVAGPRALARFAADAPLNTDDRPVVAYRAPRITYAADSRPRERLLALLGQVTVAPEELLVADADATRAMRLSRYWTARNRFIEAGRDVRLSGDVRVMLQQVREPLLAVLSISPDFRPAYEPLVRMGAALGRSEPEEARALLTQLERLHPGWPEARAALAQLSSAAR
jgi:spermidine synthase